MRLHANLRRNCAEALVLTALVLAGCGSTERIAMRQDMRMGRFVLRATSVEVYAQSRQGEPLEVEVLFRLDGGNRFERADFAENVSRRGRVLIRTSAGWRDRCWLGGVGEDVRTLKLRASPPLGSSGYVLEIGNPYGRPSKYVLDLGR